MSYLDTAYQIGVKQAETDFNDELRKAAAQPQNVAPGAGRPAPITPPPRAPGTAVPPPAPPGFVNPGATAGKMRPGY